MGETASSASSFLRLARTAPATHTPMHALDRLWPARPSPPRHPPPHPAVVPSVSVTLPGSAWTAWSAAAQPPPLPLDAPVVRIERPLPEPISPTTDWLVGGVDRVQVRGKRGGERRKCGQQKRERRAPNPRSLHPIHPRLSPSHVPATHAPAHAGQVRPGRHPLGRRLPCCGSKPLIFSPRLAARPGGSGRGDGSGRHRVLHACRAL